MNAFTLTLRPDGIAVLTLDMPGSRANILTDSTWRELDTALVAVEQLPSARGLILASGKPNTFIAGADLKVLAAVPAPNDPQVRQLIELGHAVLARLEQLPLPTAAIIDGPALGGGLEVALACDYRFVSQHPAVQLGLPEVQLGLIPGWGGTQRLPRLLPAQAAWELLATGGTFTTGPLVQSCSGNLEDTAAEFLRTATEWRSWRARRLGAWVEPSDLPPEPAAAESAAVRALWRCWQRSRGLSLVDGLQIETEEFLQLAGSAESRQRIAAFFASRKKS